MSQTKTEAEYIDGVKSTNPKIFAAITIGIKVEVLEALLRDAFKKGDSHGYQRGLLFAKSIEAATGNPADIFSSLFGKR